MKYLVATFTIETTADLMQASQDLLADGACPALINTIINTSLPSFQSCAFQHRQYNLIDHWQYSC